jgi:hypothetical protein
MADIHGERLWRRYGQRTWRSAFLARTWALLTGLVHRTYVRGKHIEV